MSSKLEFMNFQIRGKIPSYLEEEITKIKEQYKLGVSTSIETREVQRGTTIIVPEGHYIVKHRSKRRLLHFVHIPTEYFRGKPCRGFKRFFIPRCFKRLYVIYRKTLLEKGVILYICK